ncbi:hypothetical protein AYX13_07118, partial [Cryptococcus neoformans]
IREVALVHLHRLVVGLFCCAVWSESRVENCGVLGEIGHEIAEVVDEAEK